jgi:hypothetical protein
MKKFLLPRDDIILNLLKLSECVCDDGVARSIMNSHALVPPNEMVDTHSVMRFAIIQLWLSLLIVSILMCLNLNRLRGRRLIWFICACPFLLNHYGQIKRVKQESNLQPSVLNQTVVKHAMPWAHIYSGGKNVPRRQSFQIAPWDASEAAGGNDLIKNECQLEIDQSGCEGKLPLLKCLEQYDNSSTWLSDKCNRVLDRCSIGDDFKISRFSCKDIVSAFQYPDFNKSDAMHLERLIQRIHEVFSAKGITYWMAAGSSIGSLYHHGRIPWDDDVDMYVSTEDIISAVDQLKREKLGVHSIKGCDRKCISVHKVYDPSLPHIPSKHKGKHSFPFVDIFAIKCNDTMCLEMNEWAKGGQIDYPRGLIFPLHWRPFGRLSLPFPGRLTETIENRYGSDAKKHCIRGAYNHKTETFLGRKMQFDVQCKDLPLPPAMVAPEIRPWAHDLPGVTVEHLMDNITRLSSVTFLNGNEFRRSYADGLMNTNDIISFHFDSLDVLVPFLSEERESYAQNRARRSAQQLNLEVLPMLDIPEVGNNFVSEEPKEMKLNKSMRLKVGEWNAERW